MSIIDFIDVGLLLVLVVGAIAGLVKGMIRQVVELVGLVASYFVAVLFAGWLATVLQERTALPYSPSLVISFAAIFIIGLIAVHFIALILHRIVHLTFLGWVDRMGGAAVGIIIGLIINSLIVTVGYEVTHPSGHLRQGFEQSRVAIFVRPIAPWIFDAVLERVPGDIDFRSIFRHGGPV
jgi:uncharacterized membrane protein required for colicin V production